MGCAQLIGVPSWTPNWGIAALCGADKVPGVSDPLDDLGVSVIRGISMDGPQAAGNGHPGTAIALAPLAHVLFTRIMRHDPSDPTWPDRDRFVLSPGHASILLYAMLHLTGYGVERDDLMAFRQLGSLTPGHPERGHTPGVEVTTGPLGQGIGNAVGMAMAEAHLRARFGDAVSSHHTFAIVSDGDLMEGISHEASSLAGHLGLGRLVCIYDDNHITIDGPTELAFTDDPVKRFESYGWHVEDLGEIANDLDALEAAIRRAMAVEDRPSMLVLRSHIAWGTSFQDSPKAHGTPLGDDAVKAAKSAFGLPPQETFWIPEDVLALYRRTVAKGQIAHADWMIRLNAVAPEARAEWDAMWSDGGLPGWSEAAPTFAVGTKMATRNAAKAVLAALVPVVPGLIAGGADLTDNTGVRIDAPVFTGKTAAGRLVHYGVREHGMSAAMNGMAAHGGVLPVGGTFFIFSDYCRPSIRLAALSELKVIWSFTHDSIGVGPDGPTHQPIEHLASLRAMPQLRVIRPADANETSHAYVLAIGSDGPTLLVLSRQDLPVLEGTAEAFEGVASGAYVLVENDDADITLVGTGSEVSLCVEAAKDLAERGITARVVSMPSWDLFDESDPAYQETVFPEDQPVLAVEAGSSFGWERYADAVVSIDTFGASGPTDAVFAAFGFTPQDVADAAEDLLDAMSEEEDDEDDEDD